MLIVPPDVEANLERIRVVRGYETPEATLRALVDQAVPAVTVAERRAVLERYAGIWERPEKPTYSADEEDELYEGMP